MFVRRCIIMREHPLYTIGHSNHPVETFLGLLTQHGISVVADVRSQPYSRIEHFNQGPLRDALLTQGIRYVFLGRELGARREERECYVDGQAIYERVATLPAFHEGIERLLTGLSRYTVALLCAEREPLDCHRTILVCRQLRKHGITIGHILGDGSVETHEDLERRLVREMGVQPSLFEPNASNDDLIELAYSKRGRDIAFKTDSEEVTP